MPTLRLLKPRTHVREIEITASGLTIGRGVENDLHLINPWLSRNHAAIESRKGRWMMVDKGSRNGTFVNGTGVEGARPLANGDRITIGEVEMQFTTASPVQDLEVQDVSEAFGEGTVILDSDQFSFDRFREERSRAPISEQDLMPTLSAFASALIVHMPLDRLVEEVLNLIQQAVPSERAALLLHDEEEKPVIAARRGFADESVRISRTLIDTVLEERRGVLTVDARSDQRFDAAQSIMLEGIRSILCVPLWNNQDVIGLVYFDRRFEGDPFASRDLRLVGLMANMAAVKIENARLLAVQLEQERLQQQMAVAGQIQRKLLPARAPDVESYALIGDSWPCFEIGGDYFDYVTMPDGRIAIVVADISGKGVGAALLMAVLQASLRALIHAADGPADLVSRLNRVLIDNSPYNKFATLFYAELDPETHQLVYVNGGHNPGLLSTADGISELESTGPIVGMLDEAHFGEVCLRLAPGDTVLLYTDGVTELEDPTGEQLGLEPVRDIMDAHEGPALRKLVSSVRQLMADFGGGNNNDDATIVAIQRQ